MFALFKVSRRAHNYVKLIQITCSKIIINKVQPHWIGFIWIIGFVAIQRARLVSLPISKSMQMMNRLK